MASSTTVTGHWWVKPARTSHGDWTNKFNYKRFDLTVTLTGQWGGHLYSLLGRTIDRNSAGPGRGNLLAKWLHSWFSEEDPGDGITPSFLSTTTSDLYDTRWHFTKAISSR